jgi:cholesterol oxidase
MAHDVTASAPRTEPGGSFDVVVIGSGFGGSVMAYRLACAGLSVCVLERGRAYPPGSFPRTPKQMSRNFWDPSENLFGLFDIWSFRQAEAIVSSGLGGGSLIYANVLLRKDENWFVQEPSADQGGEWWPLTRDDLDPHYDNVEDHRLSVRGRDTEDAGFHVGREGVEPPRLPRSPRDHIQR